VLAQASAPELTPKDAPFCIGAREGPTALAGGLFFSSCIPANSKKDRRARLGARSIRFLRGFSSAAINGGSVPETDAKTLLPFRAEGPPALPHRHGVRPEEKGRPCDFGTNVPLSALPH
jgi:hypothetical protein